MKLHFTRCFRLSVFLGFTSACLLSQTSCSNPQGLEDFGREAPYKNKKKDGDGDPDDRPVDERPIGGQRLGEQTIKKENIEPGAAGPGDKGKAPNPLPVKPSPPAPPAPPRPTHVMQVSCGNGMRLAWLHKGVTSSMQIGEPDNCALIVNALNGKSFPMGNVKVVLQGGASLQSRCNKSMFAINFFRQNGGSTLQSFVRADMESELVCEEVSSIINNLKI